MLRLREIHKSFGATRAVADASLEVRPGEIVAVVGENGAGKTTLMRIAAGALAADRGGVERKGRVALVHQHFMLVPELTIAENLALAVPGRRFFSRRSLERETRARIAATGIALDGVGRRISALSVGEQSKVELIKALAQSPATLILDEPTSVLTPRESDELFDVVRMLAANGTAVVFISHKIAEVLRVAQRVVVMRAGTIVAEHAAAKTTVQEVAAAMVQIHRSLDMPDTVATARRTAGVMRPLVLQHENLHVHQGEIVAIAGVAGNGQNELASRLRDLHPHAGHVPEDRTRDGIIAAMSITDNLALRRTRWARDAARQHARHCIELFSIKASGPDQKAGELSGGNQQKVILARELDRRPALIVAAEPTRGLDFESSAFVHAQLRAAAEAGAGIVLITSDLDEAFVLADAIHVMHRGALSEPLAPDVPHARIADLMAGLP